MVSAWLGRKDSQPKYAFTLFVAVSPLFRRLNFNVTAELYWICKQQGHNLHKWGEFSLHFQGRHASKYTTYLLLVNPCIISISRGNLVPSIECYPEVSTVMM
jgi:hypothetical protein